MKFSICVHILFAFYVTYGNFRPFGLVTGQYFENPKFFFEKMTFDQKHRGSFNNSECTQRFINCMEVVRPDAICVAWYVYYESVCGVLREHCNDRQGDYTYYQNAFPLFESLCLSWRHSRET